jgi:hypothetical protein
MSLMSVIVTEIAALRQRHELRSKLSGRPDIVSPEDVPSELRREIVRQQTAGLDLRAGPGTAGWPLPTGGRYERLCFSTIPEIAEASGKVAAPSLHMLPTSEAAFIEYVEFTTGIGRTHLETFHHRYRFDAIMLAAVSEQVREADAVAWRLLLSHEWDMAIARFPALNTHMLAPRFKMPVVVAFRILAALERAHLIMRRMHHSATVIAKYDLPSLLVAPQPLHELLSGHDLFEVYRLVEYNALSTNVLRDFILAKDSAQPTRGDALFLHHLQQGQFPEQGIALADDRELRAALAEWLATDYLRVRVPNIADADVRADTDNGVPDLLREAWHAQRAVEEDRRRGGRHDVWRTPMTSRWYRLSFDDVPVAAIIDSSRGLPMSKPFAMPSFPHLAALGPSPGSREVHQILATAMRESIRPHRPGMHRPNTDAATQRGEKLAKLYVPPRPKLGSAPRFDWAIERSGEDDLDLWDMLQGRTQHKSGWRRRMRLWLTTRRKRVYFALHVVRNRFPKLFELAKPDSVTAVLARDLANAFSPVSANQTFVNGLGVLFSNGRKQRQIGYDQKSGGYRNKSPR